MESRCFAIVSLLCLFILNALFSIPAATSVSSSTTTFIVQIGNLMDDTLFAACNLNGRNLPKKEIKIGEEANFTMHLGSTDNDMLGVETMTMTCDLRSGDKHGSFVMFDTLNWNVSSYCAPHNVCIWKVVPRGLCLSPQFFNCPVIYYWP